MLARGGRVEEGEAEGVGAGAGGGSNIVYSRNIKFVIFDRPEMKYVRAKMYLAGYLDR